MRCYVSEFLDKSYDEGVYFALVTKMDCLKPPGRPTRAFKRCHAATTTSCHFQRKKRNAPKRRDGASRPSRKSKPKGNNIFTDAPRRASIFWDYCL